MSLKNTRGSSFEPISQEVLESMTQAQLIKVIRVFEGYTKGRKVLGHLICAVVACAALPFLVYKFQVFGFLIAPFVGIFFLYVMDQTVVFLSNRKTNEQQGNDTDR